jgi:surface-adhesin protein E
MTVWGVAIRAAGVAAAVMFAAHAVSNELREDRARWLVVERDSEYTIALDTSRIVREYGRTYEIWYRTDHASKRFYRGKAFTRETVNAILGCDGYRFRVISTTMSMGSGRSVVHQAMDSRDLAREAWHSVEPGSADEKAALATCELADWKSWARR